MDTETVFIRCKKCDLRHVAINCRCGTRSVAEIPEQLARAKSLHFCPNCHSAFVIQQKPDASWKIERREVGEDTIAFSEKI